MLIDLSYLVGDYLVDVFVIRLDWWTILGLLAQGLFGMRLLLQWIASERAGHSVIPLAFWVFSIAASLLLFGYALHRRDAAIIAGQAVGVFVYLRNVYFVLRDRKAAAA